MRQTWMGRALACSMFAASLGGFFSACSSSSDLHPIADAAVPSDTGAPNRSGDGSSDAVNKGRDASMPGDDEPDAMVADVGTDSSSSDDSGLPAAASLWASAALPAWDAATVAHVRQVRALGQTKGNHLDVVAKLGDSITASAHFLYDIGNGTYALGSYSALGPTIDTLRNAQAGGGKNPFNRDSVAAKGGWASADVLAGVPSFVQKEVAAIRPAYAIVMFGTNDGNAATFATNMNQIVDQLEGEGVVTVVSTIPERTDYNGAGTTIRAMNTQVRNLTLQRHLPRIDLFEALAPLPDSGLGPDQVHPSVRGAGTSGYFDDPSLQYGYNVRNLTAIQMLDRLRALPQ